MQSSQVTVVIYLVWALSLFLIAGGANSITAYYLEDNKQWNSSVFNILQNDIYFCIVLFQLLYPRTQEAKKDRKCSNSITLEHKTSVMASYHRCCLLTVYRCLHCAYIRSGC